MSNLIYYSHDKFFRAALSDARVARAFFEMHLPAYVKAAVDLETLQLKKESYVDEQLKLSLMDMLFSVLFNSQPGYLYVLVEQQSVPDKLMPFRFLKYIVNIMEQHLKTHQNKQLPVIYPLLFYTGQTTYPYSTDLFELFGNDAILAKQIWGQPFQLIDVCQIPDETLRENVWSGIMQLCMKHSLARDIHYFFENVVSLFQQAQRYNGSTYVQPL